MQRSLSWDVFCRVIDNHGDLGVCWRLARQLRDAGQHVRLWVDDASALAWMAPDAARGQVPGIELRPWSAASTPAVLDALAPADVWVEAFGCQLPEPFVAHAVARRRHPPAWINLEYLSAEDWSARCHGLPSPVMSGPARGWTKHFFYPGFTPDTGGLLREADLAARQAAFDRAAWRAGQAPCPPSPGQADRSTAPTAALGQAAGARWVSLFCYEPAALGALLDQLAARGDRLLVAPGRPRAAVQQALATGQRAPAWTARPYTDQHGFDQLLWACDLNFVRGEDSLVRALWAGQPFVWQLYPQHDDAHHAKLEAFLDWLQAPPELRRFHQVWNGQQAGSLPALDDDTLADWRHCAQAARQRLWAQHDLAHQLTRMAGRLLPAV